jgi:hypothetical protein
MQVPQQAIAAPAEIQRAAGTYRMGAISAVYGPNMNLVRVNRRGAGGMLLFGLAACILGIASLAGGAAGWVWIILGVAAGGGGSLFFLIRASHVENKNVKIYICEQGLIYKSGESPAEPYRWDQIAAVWRQVKITHNYASRQINPVPIVRMSYTVERRDGHNFLFDHTISKSDVLYQLISTKVKEILLPQALQDYARGHTLTFGSLALNQQGIIQDQKLLPWNQIEAIDAQIDYNKEIVRVKQQGTRRNWADVTTSTIPNLAVFHALVDYALKKPGPSPQRQQRTPSPPAKAFPVSPAPQASPSISALDILQQRFARGEIDAATYQQMRDLLTR